MTTFEEQVDAITPSPTARGRSAGIFKEVGRRLGEAMGHKMDMSGLSILQALTCPRFICPRCRKSYRYSGWLLRHVRLKNHWPQAQGGEEVQG